MLDRLSLPNKQQEYVSRPVVEKPDNVPEVRKISAEKQESYEQQQQQNQQQHSREQTVGSFAVTPRKILFHKTFHRTVARCFCVYLLKCFQLGNELEDYWVNCWNFPKPDQP